LSVVTTVVGACSGPPPPEAAGTTVRVVESYGAEAARSVTLTASLSPEVDGVIEISNVSISIQPGTTPLVQKLEMLLEDAGFRWPPGQSGWPELARSVPPEAVPMARRLQLALLLFEGAPDFQVDHGTLELFSKTSSLGTTRIARQRGEVTMTSLALVSTGAATTFAWGHASGRSVGDTYTLMGVRHVGDEPPEPVRTEVTRVQSPRPPVPAGR